MSKALKPCPFCGGTRTKIHSDYYECSYVECKNCCATGPVVYDGEPYLTPTVGELKQTWNRRRHWIPFREAVHMPAFVYGMRYPAKFPTAPKDDCYGSVMAAFGEDDTAFFYATLSGAFNAGVSTLNSPLRGVVKGSPMIGDVLVLASEIGG